MIKTLHDSVWAFDAEWVPDPVTGRRVLDLPEGMSDEEVLERMWNAGGATPEEPRPYLKTVLCRIVSVATVVRKRRGGATHLELHALPDPPSEPMEERTLIERFLGGVGRERPQLVGFNSVDADLPILLQRAVAHGVSAPAFCARPDKPWEGLDYFARGGDGHVDLKAVLSGWGKGTPSMHELASACGLPCKLGTDGRSVAELFRAGEIATIVAYNLVDAVVTYLIWLRLLRLSGHVDAATHAAEEAELEAAIGRRLERHDAPLLGRFLERWRASRE